MSVKNVIDATLSHNMTINESQNIGTATNWGFCVLQRMPYSHYRVEAQIERGCLNCVALVREDQGTSYYTEGTPYKLGVDPTGYEGWSLEDFEKYDNPKCSVDGTFRITIRPGTLTYERIGSQNPLVLENIPPSYCRLAIGAYTKNEVRILSVVSLLWECRGPYLLLGMLLRQ
eukprot:PhF_6_TR916/c0_g1_i3/m.1529